MIAPMVIILLSMIFALGRLEAQTTTLTASLITLAGNGVIGSTDGVGSVAQFYNPQGVAVDNVGNIYVADSQNHCIRKIDRFGNVSTFAGSTQGYADGIASQAQFFYPTGVAVDATGNVYVADYGNHRIRKISLSGNVTTIAGGEPGNIYAGSASLLTHPHSLVLDQDGNIYVTDSGNLRIRKITPSGNMTTFAGSSVAGYADGSANQAQFSILVKGIAIDASRNLWVADRTIRKISPNGDVTTPFTDSLGYKALSEFPWLIRISPHGIAVDKNSNVWTVSGENIYRFSQTHIGVFSQNNSMLGAETTQINFDAAGNLVIGCGDRNIIRKFSFVSGLGQITNFSPRFAATGEAVTIQGSGFTNALSVAFGGVPVQSFVIVSDSVIVATVGSNVSGDITIQTSLGAAGIGGFQYLPPPHISGFSPAAAPANTPITINGSGFIGMQGITIGGVPVQSFNVISPTQITVVLGSNAVSGDVQVITSIDTARKEGFTFVRPPSITSFSPSSGLQGDTVQIVGVYLSGTNAVRFGGTQAQSFNVINDSLILAVVGTGSGGAITAINSAGTATRNGFTYIMPPSISAFTPINGGNGTSVTITGAGFTGVSSVSFGGVNARSFTVQSPTQIDAVVDSGATGVVRVENRAGNASQGGFTYFVSPVITGFMPSSAQSGQTVTITGKKFTGVTQVQFGGTNAQSFSVQNDSTIQAIVGGGSSGGVGISNPSATSLQPGFSYLVSPTAFSAQSPVTSGAVGAAFTSYTFVSNGTPAPTYSLASGTLPTGLTLSALGLLSGAPTQAGTYTFSVNASNGLGTIASSPVTIIINPFISGITTGQIGNVTMLAGSGTLGYADGTGTAAQFNQPSGVCSDGAGNLFVADYNNHRIRKIVIATGMVTTLAGNGFVGYVNGTGTAAQFNQPSGVCSDGAGNLFVSEMGNNRIRKIVIATGVVTTLAGSGTAGFADGTGAAAQFSVPFGVCADGAGNLFVSDRNNYRIRKIVIATGVVTTLAGSGTAGTTDGTGASAQFGFPLGVCHDGAGNLFVVDAGTRGIRKIVIATGAVTTLAGGGQGYNDGMGTAAQFYYPYSVCSDGAGNLFVTDFGGNRIRRIVIATGVVTTFAGNTQGYANGTGAAAQFFYPWGVCSDGTGNLFVTDSFNHRIRHIVPTSISAAISGTTFPEAAANNGSITQTRDITLTGDTWAPAGVFTAGTHFVATGIPAGLTIAVNRINTTVVRISFTGNATAHVAADSATFTLRFTDAAFGHGIASAILGADATTFAGGVPTKYTITFNNASSVAPTAFSSQTPATSGVLGTAFTSYTFVANGTPVPTYTIASGSLPTGLTLSASGVLSGTPTTAGAYTFTVQASNGAGNLNSNPVTITVTNPNVAPSAFSAQTPATSGVVGTTFTPYTFAVNGSPAPTYAVVSGSMPHGLTLNPTTGVLSGTPTNVGTYTFTVQASNVVGNVNSNPVTITVTNPNVAPSSFSAQMPSISGVVGTAFPSYAFVANGTPTPTYSLTSGALPAGLMLSAAGVLSGTPTVAGTYTFSVSATNGLGAISSAPTTLTIAPLLPGAVYGALGNVGTLAGNGFGGQYGQSYGGGFADGTGAAAQFQNPYGVCNDGAGHLFVADLGNRSIRKIVIATGVVTTLAGSGITGYTDGTGGAAQFNAPRSVCSDGAGNLFVTDGNRIRKIVIATGVVTTLAGSGTAGYTDGTGGAAQFNTPQSVCSDGAGNLFVTDLVNNRIRKVVIATGMVTTLAGSTEGYADGTGAAAQFNYPYGVCSDGAGNLFVGDLHNNRIRKIVIATGEVTTLAGGGTVGLWDGIGTAVVLGGSYGVCSDGAGNLFIAQGSSVRKVVIATGVVTNLAGISPGTNDGTGAWAQLYGAYSVCSDGAGKLFVADNINNRIRSISLIPTSTVISGTAFSEAAANDGSITQTRDITITGDTWIPTGAFTAGTHFVATGIPAGLTIAVNRISPTVARVSFTGNASVHTEADSASFSLRFTDGAFGYGIASAIVGADATTFAGGVPTRYTITFNNASLVAPTAFSAQTPVTRGVAGTAFTSYTFVANGTPTSTYSVASGTLPTGLTLSASGILSGTPTVAGTFTFTVQASNVAGNVNSTPVTIAVTNPNVAPSVFSAQMPATSGVVGTAFTSYTFVANGTPTPTYSIASGILPTGLTLSASGVLSGTPSAAGSYTFIVQASNSAGSVPANPITISIDPATTTITSFNPTATTIGNYVTIRGTGFSGASLVRFGTVSALGFTVVSDTVITAQVGAGASGAVSVTTPLGTVSQNGFVYTLPPPPIIGSFSPTTARPGDTVVIRGVYFLSTSSVSFGGAATPFRVVSDTVIYAYITASAASGAVRVITQGGTSNLNGFTFVALPAAPRVTSFTPNRAAEGASVIITGTSFTGTSRVKFGAFDAASYVVNSATQITAVVGSGASGAVSVQNAGGTGSLNGFTFVPPSATLTAFTPTSAAIGQTVVITGTNLSSALMVEFGGRSAAFTVNSDTQITATIPTGTASGNVTVTTLAGAVSLTGFTFLAPPTITSFTPTSASAGASMVISGANFTSADTVRIGGVVATFTVDSPSQITATVPVSAVSGSVSVRTQYGAANLSGFTFLPAPVITSFSPVVAGAADVVTINGSNFTGTSSVSFGGTAAASFTVVSATRITATLSASGSSGAISVTTPNGTGSRVGFSFAGVPTITAFSPTGATGGDTVTITGTNFVGVSAVSFGNTAASGFTVVSPTEIKAVVSASGSSGAVRVTTPGGAATLNGFTFTAPAPVITGFSPSSATVEQTVTITGRNFSGAMYSTLAVSFGGRAAGRFTVVNDSTIQAVVGGGATGSVSVRTPGGTANRAGFTFIPAPPIITGFTPTSAPAGATITISGNNFFATSAVRFGGVAGTNIVVVNDSTVTVRVGATGATGAVTLTTPSGTATLAGFTFNPAPIISAFTPTSASVGDTVTFTGTGFTGATAVRFGGTAATRFTVVSDTQIQAVVGNGATGAVSVITPNGTGTLVGFTFVPPAPRITSFSPTTAAAGTSVVINGANFTGTTAVSFGGVAAQSFVINSATRITAVVAVNSASGDVSVTSPNGIGTRPGFTFLAAPPVIVSFSPTSAGAGGTVLIRGTGFASATAVRFGGVAAASFTRTGDTLISARVATGGASGDVSVQSIAGTGSLSGFVFIPTPTITAFTPTSAAQGDTVTITGTNLAGTTNVSFGGSAASIVGITPTQVSVIVGGGATGSASLTTPGGTATRTGFIFLPPGPRITGFTPATATPGTSVIINGANFTGATAVSFGGVAAVSFTVNSATRITAVVPASGASGAIAVTTPNGTATMAGFTFTLVPAPVITSFTPTSMPTGSTTTMMTINGQNFTGATAVSVGGVAVPFTVVSATRITARLSGALAGAVSVTTPGGTATMAGFTLAVFTPNPFDGISSIHAGLSSSMNEGQSLAQTLTSVETLETVALVVYPNPARESVTLSAGGFAEGRAVTLRVVDVLGNTVMTSVHASQKGNLQVRVDMSRFASGAYTFLLSDGTQRKVVRCAKVD